MIPANCVMLVAKEIPGLPLRPLVEVIYEFLDGTKIISKLDLARNLIGIQSFGSAMLVLIIAWLSYTIGLFALSTRSSVFRLIPTTFAAKMMFGATLVLGGVLATYETMPSYGFFVGLASSFLMITKARKGEYELKSE